MRMRPLLKIDPLQSSQSAIDCRVTCVDCAKTLPYVQAQGCGWGFDLDGVPFVSYYCASCASHRMVKEINDHRHSAYPERAGLGKVFGGYWMTEKEVDIARDFLGEMSQLDEFWGAPGKSSNEAVTKVWIDLADAPWITY